MATRLEAIDLNLLLCLGHLLETRSVSAAASRMGVSQPTMSHHLRSLRGLLNDALLERRGRQMVLTPYAASLQPTVAEALGAARRALQPAEAFEPATAQGEIHVAASDYAGAVVFPELLSRLREHAPGLALRMHPVSRQTVVLLNDGSIDMAIAPNIPFPERDRFVFRNLFEERFVCAMRRGHPLGRGRLTIKRFANAGHLLCAPSGGAIGAVDRALEPLGLRRRVVATTAFFALAPQLVATSDLIAALPERLADQHRDRLTLRKLPLDVEGFTMQLAWHPRTTSSPRHRWLRAQLPK